MHTPTHDTILTANTNKNNNKMNVRIIENASKIIAKAISNAIDNAPEYFSKCTFRELAQKDPRYSSDSDRRCPYYYPIGDKLARQCIEAVGEVSFMEESGVTGLGKVFRKEKIYRIKQDVKKPTPKDVEKVMYHNYRGQLDIHSLHFTLSNIPTSDLLSELSKREMLSRSETYKTA